MNRRRVAATALTAAGLLAAGIVPAVSQTPKPFDPTPAGRETEPVVLTGANFAGWAAAEELTAKVPTVDGKLCLVGQKDKCTHNQYEEPEVATGAAAGTGVAVDRLIGYRWDAKKGAFKQIPFQVDEVAVRYLSNHNSGFAFYSETDQNVTYVYDQDRWNWTSEDPANPCIAKPRDNAPAYPDTVPGLDTNDEVVFMADDAGPLAPIDAPLPKGTVDSRQVVVTDPTTGQQSYAYVMLAGDGAGAATPAFDASNGYVRYLADADSDTYLYSQSSYGNYGATYKGSYFDPATKTCVKDNPKQRRPKDTAWVKTPRYAFRYDGRWLMTQTRVASAEQEERNADNPDPSTWEYGPDLIDQWKARAFQQRPGGETPCCGYEEEVNNWGGSSMLMGYRAGPVRVIRAAWGADSSTNNIRTEIFYRSQMHEQDKLRVHVIPPFDGIYAQWDFNAGKMTRYSNPFVPEGVKIDGKNDEVFGNSRMHIASDGVAIQADDKTGVTAFDEQMNKGIVVGSPGARCPSTGGDACVNNDIDTFDPTLHGPAGTLAWEQTSGPFGTFVDRTTVRQHSAGTAYTLATTPYYRDDSCFDDGTGTDPGPHVKPRAVDPVTDSNGQARECWDESMGDPMAWVTGNNLAFDHLYQGDIGTHGVHILLIAESDNAGLTAPLTEIDSDQRRVILNGYPGDVGEVYGRGLEKPLVAAVTPERRAPADAPGNSGGNGGNGGNGESPKSKLNARKPLAIGR